MMARQGDIYWVQTGTSEAPDIPHPHVIVQDGGSTVMACALTSNLRRVSMPGNVLLDAGEANLPRPSVVEVSKIATLERAQLGDYIGTLSARRLEQILAGMRFVQRTTR